MVELIDDRVLDQVVDVLQGNETIARRTLDLFDETVAQDLRRLRAAAGRDAAGADRAAHRIAGSAASLGGVALADEARRISEAARGGAAPTAAEVEALVKLVARTSVMVRGRLGILSA